MTGDPLVIDLLATGHHIQQCPGGHHVRGHTLGAGLHIVTVNNLGEAEEYLLTNSAIVVIVLMEKYFITEHNRKTST